MDAIEINEKMFRLDEWEPEYGIGRLGSGLSKVEPYRYHVRITINKSLPEKEWEHYGKIMACCYTKYWNLNKFIWGYELSKDGQPHIHGAVEFPEDYNTSTMSKFMKKFKTQGYLGTSAECASGYNHSKETDISKNEKYCAKDNVILLTNYTENELKELRRQILAIQEDMKAPVWLKLVNKLKPWADDLNYQPEIWELKLKIAKIYKDDWNKAVPGNLKGTIVTVALELDIFDERDLANYM